MIVYPWCKTYIWYSNRPVTNGFPHKARVTYKAFPCDDVNMHYLLNTTLAECHSSQTWSYCSHKDRQNYPVIKYIYIPLAPQPPSNSELTASWGWAPSRNVLFEIQQQWRRGRRIQTMLFLCVLKLQKDRRVGWYWHFLKIWKLANATT